MADKVAFQATSLVEPTIAPSPPGGVPPVPSPDSEEYLVTDGLPMADSDVQALTMRDAHYMLEHHFHKVRGDPNVYVAIDTFVHYKRYNRKKKLAPDVMVVLGVEGHLRNSYVISKEGGQAPDFVLEVLSRSTHLTDQVEKREAYESMGVQEYFQYDPKGKTLCEQTGYRLQGERLEGGRWEMMERQGGERVYSEVLGLELRVKRREREPGFRELRFRNLRTGSDLPTYDEAQERANAERAAREREAARADAERAAREREAARADAERAAREREAARAERRSAEGRLGGGIQSEAARADAERLPPGSARLRGSTRSGPRGARTAAESGTKERRVGSALSKTRGRHPEQSNRQPLRD